MITNRNHILQAITSTPGLSDREVRQQTAIRPHQQVNQITNRLAREGVTRRVKGGDGVWRNYPTDVEPAAGRRAPEPPRVEAPEVRLRPVDSERTLIVLQCSARKRPGGSKDDGPSILDHLPSSLAAALRSQRAAIARRAGLDETRRLPAWRRYAGYLYEELSPDVTTAVAADAHVLILSGGYGVVLAREPIGVYDTQFKTGRWPGQLVSRCLVAYVDAHHLDRVIAFTSATTDYATAVRAADWQSSGASQVWHVTPEIQGGGAMVRAPRALGQAITAAWRDELSAAWRSSGGDSVRIARLVPPQ